jgi:hypothetical protein
MEEIEVVQPKSRPAITISIQSWGTPIVGVVMLIIGLLGGYYGRPLIGGAGEQAAVPRTIAPVQAGGAGAGNEELMDYLISQARHFTGDPGAPVTLIEFGDFQ